MDVDLLLVLKKMITIRMVEQYIAFRYPEQKMQCPTHLCTGQEVVPAVCGSVAGQEDVFMGTYRSHGHYLAKGGSLTALFAELLGTPNGCAKGFGGSMHLVDVRHNFMGTSAIVGSGIPIAAGAALSARYRKRSSVIFVFFGDAAIEEGVVYETVNFAILHRLPILFVCENNRLAITTPIELRQASTDLSHRFEALGLSGHTVMGSDAERLCTIVGETSAIARAGKGPAFIECSLSRWSAHVGHATDGPLDAWWQDPKSTEANACPIAALICLLLERGLLDMTAVQRLRETTQKEINEAYIEATKAASFSAVDLPQYVYSSPLESKLPTVSVRGMQNVREKEQDKLVNPF